MASIKINSLELENVKRVHHVQMEPSANGLTVIGGKNAQGKTSILDAIAWALGGDKYRPQHAQNAEAMTPPKLKVELSNGLIVERRGAKGSLYVTDPTGQKAGQGLLDSFIEKLALDLPKFMQMNDKDKAKTLLGVIGVEVELAELQEEEDRLTNERLLCGRDAEKKKHYAESLGPYEENVPEDPISATELIQQQQAILLRNAENQKARAIVHEIETDLTAAKKERELLEYQHKQLIAELKAMDERARDLEQKLSNAQKSAAELKDEATDAIEANLQNIEDINKKVAFNKEKRAADQEAKKAAAEYDDYTAKIKEVRDSKLQLLQGADLPLEGLTVENDALQYNGHPWQSMSGAEQLKVACAIVRKLRPECGFVLMDELEKFDADQLAEFGTWLEKEGLQVIATRVSTGEECQIIIEDGYIKEEAQALEPAKGAANQAAMPVLAPATGWTPGAF